MKPLETVKKIFIPTPGQAIASFAIALGLIVIAYRNLLISAVAQRSYVPESDIALAVSQQLEMISQYPYVERLSVGVFWAVVACVVYLAYIVLGNVLIGIRNDYIIDTQFKNEEGNWRYRIRSFGTKLGWLILLVGLILFTVTTTARYWLMLVGDALVPFAEIPVWYAAIGLIGLAINIYLIWMLWLSFRHAE